MHLNARLIVSEKPRGEREACGRANKGPSGASHIKLVSSNGRHLRQTRR